MQISISPRHAGGNFQTEMSFHVSGSHVPKNGQSNHLNQSLKESFLQKQDSRMFR